MNHWPFVVAAHGIAVAATVALVGWSYVAMRRSEARADAVTRR